MLFYFFLILTLVLFILFKLNIFKIKANKLPLTNSFLRSKKITYYENLNGDIANEFIINPVFAKLPLDERMVLRSEQKNGYLIEIEKGIPLGKNYQLIGTEITIGRSPLNDVTIEDPMISERHVKILIVPGEMIILYDLESTNGTMINNKKVKKTALNINDIIQIGCTELRFKKESI